MGLLKVYLALLIFVIILTAAALSFIEWRYMEKDAKMIVFDITKIKFNAVSESKVVTKPKIDSGDPTTRASRMIKNTTSETHVYGQAYTNWLCNTPEDAFYWLQTASAHGFGSNALEKVANKLMSKKCGVLGKPEKSVYAYPKSAAKEVFPLLYIGVSGDVKKTHGIKMYNQWLKFVGVYGVTPLMTARGNEGFSAVIRPGNNLSPAYKTFLFYPGVKKKTL